MWQIYDTLLNKWCQLRDVNSHSEAISKVRWEHANGGIKKIRKVKLVPVEGTEESVDTSWSE